MIFRMGSKKFGSLDYMSAPVNGDWINISIFHSTRLKKQRSSKNKSTFSVAVHPSLSFSVVVSKSYSVGLKTDVVPPAVVVGITSKSPAVVTVLDM